MEVRNMSFFEEFDNFCPTVKGVRLPSIEIDQATKDQYTTKLNCDNHEFLRELCVVGFKKLNIPKDSPKYQEYGKRIKYELDIIHELNFTDYFLLVWTVINFCREKDIPVGVGRGSAAGSIVLYLIGVTKIDPIKHGLYFERFISKARAKVTNIDGVLYFDGSLLPDVDNDIDFYRRGEVIEFIEQKFKGKTSKILTFNTLSGKLLIKEIGKIVANKSEEEMTMVSHMIPKHFGVVESLDKAYETVPEFKSWADANWAVYQTALKLRDLIKNKGVHPSGILISYDDLSGTCPIELSSDKSMVSSYEMNTVSSFTVKLDVLGLRGVSVVDDVCRQLKITIEDIDLDDPIIYQSLQELKCPHGLFQIEADLACQTVRKVKPKNLGELSAVLALARPGALQFIDRYARYTNTGTTESVHPFFDDVLDATGGLCLYQEQLLKMFNKVGFTLDESEIIRRIVGKKKKEEMLLWEKKIEEKVLANKLDPEIKNVLWKIADDSAKYSFNASHSFSYASLSAATVYLKFKHPKEFYFSLLKMSQNEPDPLTEIAKIQREMYHFGIELLPPSLSKSSMGFTIEGNNIRFGLSAIKGVSDKTIVKFNNFDRASSNKFKLFQSAKEAGLNVGLLSALIQAGCMRGFGENRPLMVYEAQLWSELTDKERRLCLEYGERYQYELPRLVKDLAETLKDDKGNPLIKASRFETIKKATEPYKEIYNLNRKSPDFANWIYEKENLGYVFSQKLIDIYSKVRPDLVSIRQIKEENMGKVSFVGQIMEKPASGISRTAKKSRYIKYQIGDEEAQCKVMIFNDSIDGCISFNGRAPEEGEIVIVTGTRKDEETIFANEIIIPPNKVYLKLSSLKTR
jgi:DNA polymerase-3 subunit alpha